MVSELLGALTGKAAPTADLIERAKALDKHYIPTRYPTGFERGAPVDFYTCREAEEAIKHGEVIVEFCRNQIG